MSAAAGRLGGMAALTGVALVLSAVPALQFDHWPWIVLVLTAPVLVAGAWPAHRRAASDARAGRVGGDTLLSLALLAALARSLWLLLVDDAGRAGAVEAFTVGSASAALTLATAAALAVVAAAAGPAAGPAARVAARYAPVVLGFSVAGFGFWFGAAGAAAGVTAAVTVLLVGVPGALALCRAPQEPPAPEPGSAPEPGWQVADVHTAPGASAGALLRLAGAVAARLDHPRASALAAAAVERTGPLPDVAEFDLRPGGAIGIVAELSSDRVVAHAVVIGPVGVLDGFGIALPPDLAARIPALPAVAVAWDGVARGVVTFTPAAPRATGRLWSGVVGALAGHVVAVPAAAAGLVGPAAALLATAVGMLWAIAYDRVGAHGPPVRATGG